MKEIINPVFSTSPDFQEMLSTFTNNNLQDAFDTEILINSQICKDHDFSGHYKTPIPLALI